MEQSTQSTLLRAGNIVPGKNPRRIFPSDKMEELRESINQHGIIQAITVRPVGEGLYEIIAGERRWRVAKEQGDDYLIPVNIRDATDEEARAMALVENTERADMHPVEEAEAAHVVVMTCKGDRAEAARKLGWTANKLKMRLSLMHCAQQVREALLLGQISLGHAEILAAAPEHKQIKPLEAIIKNGLSVEVLKAELSKKALELKGAIFDQGDCKACPHNSETQRELFSEALQAGFCTNAECFQEKTDKVLVARADTLRETVPKVIILKLAEPVPVTTVEVDGARGVGATQAQSCKACSNYGATLSSLPGSIGETKMKQCFDLDCNKTKVEANRTAVAEAAKAAEAPQPKPAPAAPEGKATAPAAKAEGKPKQPEKRPVAKIDEKTLRQAIKDYRLALWRMVLAKVAKDDPVLGARLLTVALVAREGRLIASETMASAVQENGGPMFKALAKEHGTATAEWIMQAPGKTLSVVMAAGVSGATGSFEEATCRLLLKASGKQLGDYWKLDKPFFELLTKSEIDVAAREIGLQAHLEKTWPSLLSKKKDELIAAIMGAGFDFKNKLPKFMEW